MSFFDHLVLGFSTAVSPENLAYCFAGCALGTVIGVLPGIGPLATISVLLPFTFGLEPTTALIMLAGIYYGAAYGGSTTAILVKLPGETSSVVTVLDGHEMARQGRAGVAIAAAAIGSFVAGCVGTLALAAFAAPLAAVAFRFGPAEYSSLMFVGLLGAVSLSSGSIARALGMVLIGLILGTAGTDLDSGVQRFTFGQPLLWEGINFVIVAVGLFAFGEVVSGLDEGERGEGVSAPMGSLMPTREDVRRMTPSILRGTAVGSVLGVLPGAGLSVSSLFSYTLEKRVSRFRHLIGKGAIEGVAGPEAANNAAAQTAFIPSLTLGVPGSPTMALMLGAMVMHNIQPGPQVMTRNPDVFWGLVASMWIGNAILIVLNLPLVGLWVRLLRIPFRALYPAILLFCCLGVYSLRFSTFDVFLAAGFGLAGYVFRRLECEPTPLVIGFVLGPLLEENFRRALIFAEGDYTVFVREPVSLGLLLLGALVAAGAGAARSKTGLAAAPG
ncbi:MAG: tripartite tricarboxylate transporter permease [Acidobacteria bacterium]|nr:tripartite tricarboxylate transporter permease [Acidobacteriota bacterium]